MKILHISTALSWRGGEQQLAYLIEGLQVKNVEQVLLCVKESELSKRIQVNLQELSKPNSVSFTWIKEIARLSKEVDVIHVHEPKAHTFAVLSTLFGNTTPVLVTRRVVFSVKGFLSKLKYQHTSVKKIICISNAVVEEMLTVVNKEKLTIIPSCVDEKKFTVAKKVDFNFLKTPKLKIGYVAALTKEKDHITFINTAKKVLEYRKDVVFYIVGEGKLQEELEQKVKQLKLQEDILFTGFIKQISQLILQLDMLLFTSKLEGLGTTVLDFFLAKKPVVATDSLGVRDVLIHNKTGVLCNVGDVDNLSKGVLKILDSKDFTKEIVQNAYLLVKNNHSLENLAIKHIALYKSLL